MFSHKLLSSHSSRSLPLCNSIARPRSTDVVSRRCCLVVIVLMALSCPILIYPACTIAVHLLGTDLPPYDSNSGMSATRFNITLPVDGTLDTLEELAKANNCSSSLSSHAQETFVLCPPDSAFSRHAVFSASLALDDLGVGYVFYLPLTVRAWRRVGYGSLVLLVGTCSEWTHSSAVSRFVLHTLVRERAGIVFIKSPSRHNDVTIAQTARLFAAHIFRKWFPDSGGTTTTYTSGGSVLLTTDADLWPLEREYYEFPEQTGGSHIDILALNAFCCGTFRHDNRSVRMVPMSSVGACAVTWRRLMQLRTGGDATRANDILDYVGVLLGAAVRGRVEKGSEEWYLDQKVVSVRVDAWAREHGVASIVMRNRKHSDRLDRANFRLPFRTLSGLRDTHLLLEPHLVENWLKLRRLLHMMYGLGCLEWDEYHRAFTKLLRTRSFY